VASLETRAEEASALVGESEGGGELSPDIEGFQDLEGDADEGEDFDGARLRRARLRRARLAVPAPSVDCSPT
jgi:hypothetical protein